MDSIEYQREIEMLRKQISVDLTPSNVGDYEKVLVLSSANFAKVMPDIPEEDYENLCRYNYFYKRLSGIQLQNLEIAQNAKITGNLDFTKGNSIPRIFCTFHMGSYRLMNLILAKYNINFTLVVSKATLKEQKETYLKAYEDLKKLTGITSSFDFIEAENPSSVLSMLRALKSGKSLMFYIDGNTGVGGIGKTDETMLPVKLFDSIIYTRKGISFLAHKANVPIINCFSYIENSENIDNVTIQFNDPIFPEHGNKDIHEFCQLTTQRIYDEFSEILRKYPAQWEGWMYIHRYMELSACNDLNKNISAELDLNQSFIYNKRRLNSFSQGDQKYLFDKITYNTYPINEELIDLLQNTPNFCKDNHNIPQDIFHFLINKKILVPEFS
ncbi:MAG: hypothetical protein E6772_07285 [Dysgonomonas sp.]|nr:hypothetical protein [Dysgonomonas sp.]